MGVERPNTTRSRKVVFTLVVLGGLFAVLETIARVNYVEPVVDNLLGMRLVPHPTRIWSMDPGRFDAFGVTFTGNKHGQRTTPATPKKTPSKKDGTLRVLTLGDSSVVGHGLPDAHTPHAQLEGALRQAGINAEVLSGATPGYSTEQSKVLLKEHGWSLEPDLLVLGSMWSDNNLRPALWSDYKLVAWHRTDRDWLDELGKRRLQHALQRTSFAFNWLFTAFGKNDSDHFAVSWQESEIRDEGFRRVPLEQYAENLDSIALDAAQRDIGVIFLSPCNQILLQRANQHRDTSWSPYLRAMEKIASVRDLPIVSGCEVLLQNGMSVSAAFIDAMHPTATTNALYAEALAQSLFARNWPNNRLRASSKNTGSNTRWRDRWAKEADPTYGRILPMSDPYFAISENTLMLRPDQFVPLDELGMFPVDAEIATKKRELRKFNKNNGQPLKPFLVRKTNDGRYALMSEAALWVNAMRAGWPRIPATLYVE